MKRIFINLISACNFLEILVYLLRMSRTTSSEGLVVVCARAVNFYSLIFLKRKNLA
jgi:hypothetical protein